MNDSLDDIRGADVQFAPTIQSRTSVVEGRVDALQDLIHQINSETLKGEAFLRQEVSRLDRRVRFLGLLALMSWIAVMLLGVKALLG